MTTMPGRGAPRFVLDAPDLPPGLEVEAWAADDALDTPGDMVLLCLAADPALDPGAMLGCPLALVATTPGAAPWRRCGRVVEACALDGDGGLFRYRLRVRSWLALLEYGLHSRLWLQRGLDEILADVFEPYAAAARWQLHDGAAEAEARLDVVVQYRERDLDFVLRLLARAGRALRIDAATDTVHVLADTPDERQCPQAPASACGDGLAWRRPGPVEGDEAVSALRRSTRLPPRARVAASADPLGSRVVGAALVAGDGWPPSRWMAREAEFGDADAVRQRLVLAWEAARVRTRTWHGRSTVRSLAAGTWVRLAGAAAVPPLLLSRVRQAGVDDRLRARGDGAVWPLDLPWLDEPLREAAWRGGYANAFDAVERTLPWRPVACEADLPPRPRAPGLIGAEVVGREGDSPGALAADALGRVRVRLDFQQAAVAATGATTATATGWLRVLQPWGGAGVAAQWLPRVGQRVVVGFLDGDAERPVVLAGVHDGVGEGGLAPTPGGLAAAAQPAVPAGEDHRPSGQGNLVPGAHAPPWHGASPAPVDAGGQANAAAMTGWCSRELAGEGGSQLVFDDSDGALRVQLACSHAGSQLNLGRLVHQAGNRRGSERGLGFELRTDAAGALRAAQGLLLAAGASPPSAAAADNAAGLAAARGLERLARTLAAAAAAHRSAAAGVTEPAGGAGLQPACEALQAPAAAIAGHAPGGIVATADSLVESAAGTLTRAAGRDLALACASYRLHAGGRVAMLAGATDGAEAAAGLALTAAGDCELHAAGGDAALEARDALALQSVSAGVELRAARRLVLAVDGGAGIVLEGGALRLQCPGSLVVEAAAHRFVGPR